VPIEIRVVNACTVRSGSQTRKERAVLSKKRLTRKLDCIGMGPRNSAADARRLDAGDVL
jgi:hypothetical protein